MIMPVVVARYATFADLKQIVPERCKNQNQFDQYQANSDATIQTLRSDGVTVIEVFVIPADFAVWKNQPGNSNKGPADYAAQRAIER